jgi:hypothetical protein
MHACADDQVRRLWHLGCRKGIINKSSTNNKQLINMNDTQSKRIGICDIWIFNKERHTWMDENLTSIDYDIVEMNECHVMGGVNTFGVLVIVNM